MVITIIKQKVLPQGGTLNAISVWTTTSNDPVCRLQVVEPNGCIGMDQPWTSEESVKEAFDKEYKLRLQLAIDEVDGGNDFGTHLEKRNNVQ